jgi:hypothetical protein
MPGSTGMQFTPTSIPWALGRLVRIRRRRDHYGVALQRRMAGGTTELASHEGARFPLDEYASLEREPRRHGRYIGRGAIVGILRSGDPLGGVSVRVARVAVRTAEGAADVRIDRPEAHARRCRPVHYRAYRDGVILDVLLAVQQPTSGCVVQVEADLLRAHGGAPGRLSEENHTE